MFTKSIAEMLFSLTDVLHSAFGALNHLYNIGRCAGDGMPYWSYIVHCSLPLCMELNTNLVLKYM